MSRRRICRPVTVLKKGTVSALGVRSSQRLFQSLGSGSHQRMMERMIDLHEPCENSSRVPARRPSPPAISRHPAIVSERGPLNAAIVTCPVMPGDQRSRSILVQTNRKHRSFSARTIVHESGAQSTITRLLPPGSALLRRTPRPLHRRYDQ